MHLCLDTGISYLAHGSITMTPYLFPMSTFDLKVYDMAFVFGSQIFCHTILAHESITMEQWVTYIHDLCMTFTFGLNIKIIFSPWICLDKIVLALWRGHTKFDTCVSRGMLCTFMTSVWSLTSRLILAHFFYMDICGWVSLGQRDFSQHTNMLVARISLPVHYISMKNLNINSQVWYFILFKLLAGRAET